MFIKPHSNLYKQTEYKDIREAVRDGINKYSDHIAFVIKNKVDKEVSYKNITYKEFGEQVNRVGTGLLKNGYKGKKIALIGANSYEWVLSYVSVIFGVGTIMPLDKGLPAQEIEDSIIRSDAEILIFDQKYKDIVDDMVARKVTQVKEFICMQKSDDSSYKNLCDIEVEGKIELEKGNREFIDAEIDPDKPSIILFTSGTTSLSKAVMLSHKNIASDINIMNAAQRLYNTDVNLVMLPFHHTFGSTGILLMLNNGVKNVFCDGLRHIQDNMKEYKVSVFVCVPLILEAMHKRVLMQIKKQGKLETYNKGKKLAKALLKVGIDVRKKIFSDVLDAFGGHMRFVVSGAAAIDKEVAEDFNLWGILTIQGYGLTEMSPVVCAENAKYLRAGSVGIPLNDIEVEINNPNENGIGELWVKGPTMTSGYYKNNEATAESIVDGWYHTGDLGYKDKDGFIFLTGRKKNVIVLKNGKNIFPEEIEILINELPYVTECIVFGYPKDDDLVLSTKIVYDKDFVKKTYPDLTNEQFEEKVWNDIKQINTTVPKYKHVKKYIITDEPMIKTTTAKIKRFEEIKNIIDNNEIQF